MLEYKAKAELRRVGGATGPVMIKGTPSISLKERSLRMGAAATMSQTASATGTPLTQGSYKQRSQGFKDKLKGYDDFEAFEWEEVDRGIERDWYDQEEGGDYVDEVNADK